MPVFGSGERIVMGRPPVRVAAVGAAAAPAFVPTDLAGLQAWYDASQITGLANGDPVASWADATGNGHTLAQATSARRPTYVASGIGGRPSVDWDGVDDRLLNATLSLAQPSTSFVVFRTDTTAVTQFVMDGGGVTRQAIFLEGSSTYKYFAGTVVVASQSVTLNPTVLAASFNAGSSGLYHNGTLVASGNPGSQSLSNYRIGTESTETGGFYNGQIAEELHWNRTLNSTERGQVTAYLGTKYGITVV
jgi:hypothetical protein